jgi:hypothetical protein
MFVKYLIDKGAKVNGANEVALRSAAFKENIPVGMELIKYGANVEKAKEYCERWSQKETLSNLKKIEKAYKNAVLKIK